MHCGEVRPTHGPNDDRRLWLIERFQVMKKRTVDLA